MEAHAQTNPNPQSMRVLMRPTTQHPPPSPPPPPPPDPSPPPPSPPPQSSPNGIVVVGFIGRRHDDVTQLINRVVDDNVFGSGHWDTPFQFEKQELVSEEARQWFESRSISFYLDQEKGILYLQFSSTICPVIDKDNYFEDSESELGDLQGSLFMFSVCHVVVLIQEGSHFDTQLLKKFRVLQASKNALSPYLKSHIVQPMASNIHVSSSMAMPTSNNPSPGRSRGILNRGSGTMALMSGLGSHSSLLPGHCSPVTLFVFLDDFADPNSNSGMGEQAEASAISQPSFNSMARPNLPAKGSGSVVVLAHPALKSEGGFRKKLQSSLEAQIRFSIKKCRILSSSESGHVGSRSVGLSSSSPLFLLDASKAVALVDLFSNSRGASLEFATNLVEDVLDGKATSDFLLLESNGQSAYKEDILAVKEFILRQCDIFRGRGGVLSSGPAAGAGMMAVAAAAAAASAASGRTFTAPDLPNLDSWLSSSLPILQGILSVNAGNSGDAEFKNRRLHQQNAVLPSDEGCSLKVADSVKISASILESGRDLSSKFSTLWCEKALPVAKELYLKELPPCYPSFQHAAHLEKALVALRSMVKGPAVPLYIKKLEEECTSIWISGRQLCDAVSLTGKPCMHERHDCEGDDLHSRDEIKQHASGYLFLHACACGRSRQLRSDPFDFETANITFNIFPECDKLLPAYEIPQTIVKGPIQPSCWSLIRIGGAKYYNPGKGLLQSGFSATQKFLLKSTVYLGKQNMSTGSSMKDLTQAFPAKLSVSSKDEFHTDKGTKKVDGTRLQLHVPSGVGIEERQTVVTIKTDDKVVNTGRRTSSSNMKKPFSEVVAGSAGANSAFPPLQPRRQPALGAEKGIKQHDVKENTSQVTIENADSQGSQKVQLDDYGVQGLRAANGVTISVKGITNADPAFEPINLSSGGMAKGITSLERVAVYIGFEHECPRGHRFILSPDHLKDLGSSYAVSKESNAPLSIVDSDHKVGDSAKFGKNGGFKSRRQSNGIHNSAIRGNRNSEESKVRVANKNASGDGQMKVSALPRDKAPSSLMDTGASLESIPPEEDGAMSMLNRNLPLYMNCPHCRGINKDSANVKFASSISQLQRIFLVTPAFPVILAACPVIQLEESCLPITVPDREQKLQFGLGCRVILPPESFLSLRLPFVYGIELEDGKLQPLTPLDQPHLTAWIKKGTTLQILSDGSNSKPDFVAT